MTVKAWLGRTKEFDPEKLLQVWKGREGKEFGYRDLYRMAKRKFPELEKLSERTFIRYLNFLLGKGLLKKRSDEKNQQRTYYRLVPREIIRDKLSRSIQSMQIDYTKQWKTILDFAESFPRVRKEAKPLRQLTNIECGDFRGVFPTGLAKVTLIHSTEKKASKRSKELLDFLLGYKINLWAVEMVSEILSHVVSFIDDKIPDYIETTDELVEWYRDALNQQLKIVIEFDGRLIVEQTDWDKVNERAKLGLEEWEKRRDLLEKFRTTVHELFAGKIAEELAKTPDQAKAFLSDLAQQNLKSRIEYALLEIHGIFSSKDEAIQAVVEIVKDVDMLRKIGAGGISPIAKGVNFKKAVEDYLDDPESRYVLTNKRYHYPRTQRWYDRYLFVSRRVLEFQEKNEDVLS